MLYRSRQINRRRLSPASDTSVRGGTQALAWFASFVAATSTLLLLLGYGLALSAESRLGMPHSMLYQSPHELLDLSAFAVASGLTGAVELLASWDFYVEALSRMGWLFIAPTCLAAMFLAAALWPSGIHRARLWAKTTRSRLSSEKSRGLVAVVLSVLTLAATPAIVLALVLVFFTLLAVVPLLGIASGEHHIVQWVIKPATCREPASREERLLGIDELKRQKDKVRAPSLPVALCVRVVHDDREQRGRAAFYTSSAVILFDPKTGKVTRTPTDGAEIEVVGTE